MTIAITELDVRLLHIIAMITMLAQLILVTLKKVANMKLLIVTIMISVPMIFVVPSMDVTTPQCSASPILHALQSPVIQV
jgi:hypothetical protein